MVARGLHRDVEFQRRRSADPGVRAIARARRRRGSRTHAQIRDLPASARRLDGVATRRVTATIAEAKKNHHKVGFITTTSQANIDALLSALTPEISAETFDLIVDHDSVSAAKPDAAAYKFALEQLGERADSVVAIEDNVGGVAAAVQAGIPCIAFPNENTGRAGQAEFTAAIQIVESLDPATVLGLTAS